MRKTKKANKNYKLVPPPQRHLSLREIYTLFGGRPVVAYKCALDEGGVPEGGYVIAVQNDAETSTGEIKAYMTQMKDRFANKEPICFLCVQEPAPGFFCLIYDNGDGEVKALPKIEEKKSEAEKFVSNLPEEALAKALATALKADDSG